jgi:hypothetical protein
VGLLESGENVITVTSYAHLPTLGTEVDIRVRQACAASWNSLRFCAVQSIAVADTTADCHMTPQRVHGNGRSQAETKTRQRSQVVVSRRPVAAP